MRSHPSVMETQFDSLLVGRDTDDFFLVKTLQRRFLKRSYGHVNKITEEGTQLFVYQSIYHSSPKWI